MAVHVYKARKTRKGAKMRKRCRGGGGGEQHKNTRDIKSWKETVSGAGGYRDGRWGVRWEMGAKLFALPL